MLIPDSKIEEIRERIDMVALVQRHGVELKKSGRSYKGLCPFHSEKSPSFYVWADARRFKCFGCQAGGDGISFVQRLMGKSFIDTVRDLAREVGVDIEASVDPAMKEKAQVKAATDAAAQFFTHKLWDGAAGAHAREYLRTRGLTDDTIRAFGLGWAPLAWSELADHLRTEGLLAFAEKAGLVSPRQKGDGYYDTFRGRVMIPIRAQEGRVIAFGGRLLEGEDGPKYLNSRESRLYNKSEILYGVDQARDEIRKKKTAVLCEGYFDAIGLHQAGIKNAVALCSTALTPGHLDLLRRLEAKELVLLLDGDEAGRKAVERLAGPILAAGVSARVAALPDGEDPDTYARKVGDKAVQQLVQTAPSLTQYLFTVMLPHGAASSFEEKMSALDRLKVVASAVPLGLTRSAFIGAMSQHFGLPAAELEAAMKVKAQAVKAVPKPAVKPNEPPPNQLETFFAAFALKDRALLQRDTLRVVDELKHTGVRSLVAGLSSGQAPEDALYEASETLKAALQRALDQLKLEPKELEAAYVTVCRKLKLEAVKEQLARISRETSQVQGAVDLTDEARALLEQRGQLLTLKLGLEKDLKTR